MQDISSGDGVDSLSWIHFTAVYKQKVWESLGIKQFISYFDCDKHSPNQRFNKLD